MYVATQLQLHTCAKTCSVQCWMGNDIAIFASYARTYIRTYVRILVSLLFIMILLPCLLYTWSIRQSGTIDSMIIAMGKLLL